MKHRWLAVLAVAACGPGTALALTQSADIEIVADKTVDYVAADTHDFVKVEETIKK